MNDTSKVVEFPAQRRARDLQVALEKYDRFYFGSPKSGQAKLALHFTVTESGEDFGQTIIAFYRLDRIDKRGRCYAGPRSNVVRDFGRLFSDFTGKKGEPLPLNRLKNIACTIRTEWVTTDRNRVPIPIQQQYERVKFIKERTNAQS